MSTMQQDTARWYTATDDPELVEYGPVRGLSVTGRGAPGGPVYAESVRALYTVAGAVLAAAGPGGPMPPLEGRWWVEDERPPLQVPRELWCWHLFLRLPDTIEPVAVDRARAALPAAERAAPRVQLVTFAEGPCVQAMHAGPYADEPRTLARMGEFMARAGLVPAGLHHEIYLSGAEQADPAALRTILRQPVRPVSAER